MGPEMALTEKLLAMAEIETFSRVHLCDDDDDDESSVKSAAHSTGGADTVSTAAHSPAFAAELPPIALRYQVTRSETAQTRSTISDGRRSPLKGLNQLRAGFDYFLDVGVAYLPSILWKCIKSVEVSWSGIVQAVGADWLINVGPIAVSTAAVVIAGLDSTGFNQLNPTFTSSIDREHLAFRVDLIEPVNATFHDFAVTVRRCGSMKRATSFKCTASVTSAQLTGVSLRCGLQQLFKGNEKGKFRVLVDREQSTVGLNITVRVNPSPIVNKNDKLCAFLGTFMTKKAEEWILHRLCDMLDGKLRHLL